MVNEMKTIFEELLARISPKLKGITHRLNGHFTFFNDDDLYQEALEHLWVAYKSGKLADKTDSYILQGCFFHLKNYIRTAMDHVKISSIYQIIGDDDQTIGDTLSRDDHAAEDVVDESLMEERMEKLILTPKEKSILLLLMQGLTLREVGTTLGISHVMVLKVRKRLEKKCACLKKVNGEGYQN